MLEALVTIVLLPFFLIVYCAMILILPFALIMACLPAPKDKRRG